MNRHEAILAMLDGKEVTSDEFNNPDEEYCSYDETGEWAYPFIHTFKSDSMSMRDIWSVKEWRLRKYVPKHKELVWCWDNDFRAIASIRYYNANLQNTYDCDGVGTNATYDNYAPFDGTPPPNMCKPEGLIDD